MPKAKKQIKEWKPKANKLFKSTIKNKNSQQLGVVRTFRTGYRPYVRPYFPVSDFDLAKCVALDLHEDSTFLKIEDEIVDEARLDPPEPTLSYSPFGAVLASMFTLKKVDDKEDRKYKEVSTKKLPPPPADLFVQTEMRDVRWGTSPSAVGAIETEKDLEKARISAIKLLLDYKMIRFQESDFALAEKLGLKTASSQAIEDIEI